MQIQAMLRNAREPERGGVMVVIHTPDEGYKQNLQTLTQIEASSATKRDCLVEWIASRCQALKRLEGTAVNFDELDYLARRMDSLDAREATKFEATAHLLDLHEIEDFINLTFCCQEATVIDDFNDLNSVGINHFLTVNGGAPAEEVARQDGEKIARELIAGGQGKVTPFGVVYENAMRLEPHYTGQSFPPYADRDYLMEIDLLPAPTAPEETPGAVLFLPMPERRLERMLERADIHTLDDLRLDSWCSELPEKLETSMDVFHEGLFDLNRMCAAILPLDEKQRRKLTAATMFAEPEYASQIRYLAENLDQFNFVPGVKTAEEYGRYMIQESGEFSFDSNLEEFYDYEKYGAERIVHEEGRFTELGYVAYHGTMTLDELMRDDPAEQEQQMGGMG